MPNIKIYMDQGLPEHTQVGVRENLAPLREIVCRTLKVESSACQLAILLAYGLADQPVVNIEVAILPKPDRTRPVLSDLAEKIQKSIANAVNGPVAVRLSVLDPTMYISLK
ncbi:MULTISPECIES: hypothetical protein [Rhizobium]|uniref:5-carboxymethyl-2-hydroxymuconate isomerase n=1 Tax=Rhizobium leguminosarum TaxID=384 RepID=A0A1L3ZQ93_RHILE|nr:hypothetical protein [Rhizobium leguminosarum]API57707.1 hypothetical protein BMW22_41245 [Rhizobium leguminosarum]